MEDHLHLAPEAGQLRPPYANDFLAVIADGAGHGSVQLHDAARHSRLAASRFSDQSQRFTGENVEGNALYRVDTAGNAAKDAALQVKTRDQAGRR